jgi:hypothetical protein
LVLHVLSLSKSIASLVDDRPAVTLLASFSVIAGCAELHAVRRAICCGAIRRSQHALTCPAMAQH